LDYDITQTLSLAYSIWAKLHRKKWNPRTSHVEKLKIIEFSILANSFGENKFSKFTGIQFSQF